MTSAPSPRHSETGVVNAAEFRVVAAHALDTAKRDGDALSVLWLRVDRRGPTPLGGHGVERTELRLLGEALALELRRSDVVGVTGEHELAVLLPDTRPAQVEIVLEFLRASVPELSGDARSALLARVASASYEPGGADLALIDLFASARAALS